MDIRQLKIFRDIAQEKNFVKAGHMNYLTQPSISSRLKQLEEELGVKLFERMPRKVSLTREGELLLPKAEELLQKYENMKLFAARFKNTQKGSIRVATIHSIGIYELGPLLRKFMRTYPDIQIHLWYRHSQMIYDLLLKREIDVGLVAYPKDHPKIRITPFAKDSMVLIVPPDHRLAKKKSATLENIKGEEFIAFDPQVPTRQAVDRALEQRGVSVSIRTVNENIDTIKRAVEVGLGVSIVPSRTVAEEVQKGTIHALKILGAQLERPLGVLTLKDQTLSEAIQLFTNMLLENGGVQTRRRQRA